MAKYTITSISDLEWYATTPEGHRCNIRVGLRTPAGHTSIAFDPHGYDIKNMTVAELETLAIQKFEERLKD